jgi:hypothetical protein
MDRKQQIRMNFVLPVTYLTIGNVGMKPKDVLLLVVTASQRQNQLTSMPEVLRQLI